MRIANARDFNYDGIVNKAEIKKVVRVDNIHEIKGP
jgi:hypothetical protein